MAQAAAPPARKGGSGMLMMLMFLGIIFLFIRYPQLRHKLGEYAGIVLEPVIGFGGKFPVVTVMLAGTIMVVLTTVIRHFTTDWVAMAKFQAHQRAFMDAKKKAMKENNTFRIKQLEEQQMDIMMGAQKMQSQQLKTMPLTMLIVIPLFAWVSTFLYGLDFWWFSAPWNAKVDLFTSNGILFGSSVFPHWVLLYTTLTIPLGLLIQRAMKVLSWKEHWQKLHEEGKA